MKQRTGLYVGLLATGLLTTSVITSTRNCQGKEYMEGKVTAQTQGCNKLIRYLDADDSYKARCSSTLLIETKEGPYIIGALGNLEQAIEEGSQVEFVKRDTLWVTAFRKNNMGLLSSEKIKLKK